MKPSVIATLATGPAIKDFQVLLTSLEIFNENPPTVYLFCDSTIEDAKPTLNYKGTLIHKNCLDAYSRKSRIEMEHTPGKHFKNQWFDFMTEKINLLRWVFSTTHTNGVLFCDADICFLGPLPSIPDGEKLALSPHGIRDTDAKKYGFYNGGFVWMREVALADAWWAACKDSRFYEQSALETLADSVKPYEFPRTENYGWWRLWQGVETPDVLLKEWGMNRSKGGSGLTVGGQPLGSVHTHFFEKSDGATMSFNAIIIGFLRKLESHPPAKQLLRALKN